MVWAILAAIPLLFLLLLYAVRFHYHAEYESPAVLRFTAGMRFLWIRKTLAVEPGRALWGHENENEGYAGDDDDLFEESQPAAAASGEARDGQRGALRLPDAWALGLARFRARLRKAGARWILDPGVWRLMLRYAWGEGRRALWLLGPRLESLHLGLSDAYSLARLAAVWSALAGMFPALACPVSYGFGARESEIRTRVGGRFTALGVLIFALLSITSIPWAGLYSRYADCWRDPRLTRWQKRVLLP